MMKSSIDKIIQQIQESLGESLQEYANKPVNGNLDNVKSQVTSFLQSVMNDEGYDSREHIKVAVEQDSTDPTEVAITLIPLSVEGFVLIRRLEVENGKHSNI